MSPPVRHFLIYFSHAPLTLTAVIWDYNANVETPLPPMPNNVARVYPASGAVAMLPLTPANNWTPTILFCGGSDMPADDYGDYVHPAVNTWEYPASHDCQRITPEPTDGSTPKYVQDDNMIQGRTMGQFIILPDGTLLVVNGGKNGTAGYAQATGQTPNYGDMPYGMSLAAGPIGQPAIYNPNAPAGSRWSNTGLSSSNIARLYHSSAILLPDGSVMIAGSNPNVDVNTSTVYPTQYKAEYFYPPYFSAPIRPQPRGIPNTLSYGGQFFDITIPASSYSGAADAAADNTTVVLSRGGFTTHAMNMGQRYLQLNNTYTVNNDSSITLHVAQVPPNPALLTPGPALLWVVVHGVPSNGTMVQVGNGQIGNQPTSAVIELPLSVRLSSASGAGSGSPSNTSRKPRIVIIGAIVGGVVAIAILGALVGIWLRRRANSAQSTPPGMYSMDSTRVTPAASYDATGLLHPNNNGSAVWTPSTSTVHLQPRDEVERFQSSEQQVLQQPYWHYQQPYQQYYQQHSHPANESNGI